jgi:3-mercaptopropionate dioxygenase
VAFLEGFSARDPGSPVSRPTGVQQMSATSFPGTLRLVHSLDQAVQAPSLDELVANVKACLEELVREGSIELPDHLRRGCDDHYARRLVHRSEAHGYTLLAMIWEPGQGTPLHDHSGMWCVEGVLEGRIEVRQHELLEQDGELFHFRAEEALLAGPGSAGSLIPPFEYHTLRNPPGNGTAITLHVYGGEMDHCTIFVPERRDWYRRQLRELAYTA